MKRPAVFLDRDNTIIKNDGDLGDPDAVELITGVPLAIASLCGLGYRVVVVTNQGGVARGVYTEEDVESVHERIRAVVQDQANGARIDAFYACPYHPEGTVKAYARDHEDRKPRPGMLLKAAEDLDLDLDASWMVGDQLRDVAAGAAAGCRTILLGDAVKPKTPAKKKAGAKATRSAPKKRETQITPDELAPTLVEAVRIIASKRKPESNEVMGRARMGTGTSGKRFDKQAMAELQKQGRRPAQADGAEKPAAKGSARPFVPWSEARAEPEPPADAPLAQGVAGTPDQAPPAAPADGGAASESAHASAHAVGASVPPADSVHAAATKAAAPDTVSPATQTTQTTESTALASASKPERSGPAASAADPSDAGRNTRLILQELRMQRGSSDEMPQLNVLAIALQGLAALCLLGALWLGAGNDNFYTFFRWITVTLVLQVAVVTTLLFGRR